VEGLLAAEEGGVRTYRFHLIGVPEAVELEVDAATISELNDLLSRQRFIEGRATEADGYGVLAGILLATSRIQCVVEAG
jgi:hypothetical protein